jgi:hypothetical protein
LLLPLLLPGKFTARFMSSSSSSVPTVDFVADVRPPYIRRSEWLQLYATQLHRFELK